MGIHGINQTIKKYGKTNPFQKVPIKEFQGKRFAVDISIFINRFANSSQEFWFNNMVNFLLNLVKWKIEPIIVFDGINVPPEKFDERESRKTSKQTNKVREEKLQHFKEKLLVSCFTEAGETRLVPDNLVDEFKDIFKRAKKDEVQQLNLKDPEEVIIYVNQKHQKALEAAVGVQKTHKEMTKTLIVNMGLKHIQADGEAEALCSSLAFHGFVDGVISGDTDCYCYGTPLVISDIKKGIADVVYLKDILESLDLTQKQFIAICIASGTDYNKNMKNIGPAKVIPAIRKYGSIKKWREDQPNLPFHILKWKRCLEIFRPYSKEYLERCNITAMAFNAPELDNLFKEAEASYDARYVLACLEGRVEHRFIRKSLLDE
jgi:5'-3' exonuclease